MGEGDPRTGPSYRGKDNNSQGTVYCSMTRSLSCLQASGSTGQMLLGMRGQWLGAVETGQEEDRFAWKVTAARGVLGSKARRRRKGWVRKVRLVGGWVR